MFSIGEFAGLGRVSVRMLRHYDAIGLLRPAHVDPHSGYRFYTAVQLRLLNRVTALKDLGFSLHEVQTLIDEKVDPAELRGMLRLRRAELAARMRQDTARLAQVDARLRMIESEGHMDTGDVVLKSIPAIRVAQLSGTAAGYDHPTSITENLSPLYPRLMELLERHRVAVTGAPIAWYEPAPVAPGDETIRVHAAVPVGSAEVPAAAGFEVVTLPPMEYAATALHHGPMSEAFRTGQKLATWIDDNGHRAVEPGFAREVYLDCPDDLDRWVTEMQVPVRVTTPT
ncbi:MerR family transcriptional regulator [Micromonospora humi]|uniref:DNA-binding transcriptional regulator, MerR family n=1 Tax=Micromonospora humi TaxID=745366 RepID=A0A1C5K6L2_9ACTN|nr:MerR family transcriptional regulator [Micromonospora humi]SCG78086.1 DNA-binding transcriptional regulator, MerR family [Micromonospora humi]